MTRLDNSVMSGHARPFALQRARRARWLALLLPLMLGGCAVGVAGGSVVSDGGTTTVRSASATLDGAGLRTGSRREDFPAE